MSLVDIMDAHPGVASWVQAIGTILAVLSGFGVLFLQNHMVRRDRKDDQKRFHLWVADLSVVALQGIEGLLEPMRSVEERRRQGEVFLETEFGAPFLAAARNQISSISPTMFGRPSASHLFVVLGAVLERVLKEAELASLAVSSGRSIDRHIKSIEAAQEEGVAVCVQLCTALGAVKSAPL